MIHQGGTPAAVDGGTNARDPALPSRSETSSLLADSRRRHALERLRTFEDPIGLADLADEVAVAERGTVLSEIPAEAVKLAYLDLYHSHVPKLAEANVVEYHQKTDLIELAAGFTHVAPYLDMEEE